MACRRARSAGGNGQGGDKRLQAVAIDPLTPGECFERFVGVCNAVAAHHGLDGLGQYFPSLVQIGAEFAGV